MSKKTNNEEFNKLALDYHEGDRPGKIEVSPTKPCLTSFDLSLAYTPGVAQPCLEIADDPNKAYKYTAKGNLVAVISNGSAVLGLGNIGALAGKPVMEGKGVLFKRFADIDVFDIEVDEPTVEGMVKVVSSLEPTFGGVNLEDIKAPECFDIERELSEKMNIPVFHDDQHGTAIIATAGFINAVEVADKKISDVKVVFSGAGAASIACAKLFFDLGVNPQNLLMCDSKGVIYKGREAGMNKYKEEFAIETDRRSLADAMKDADAFIGCSARGILTKEMVGTMAKNPIIFAMANPEPEIYPHEVFEVRNDAIMATGRSDFPNQVNNVLGFPFIFRGALDIQATCINKEMKLAAVHALANLAKEEVPDEVKMAYDNQDFAFGRNYLIPKPFDPRVLTRVAPAVAKAAMDSGVARETINDISEYQALLTHRLNTSASFMKSIRDRLSTLQKKKGSKIKIAFAEGSNARILGAIKQILNDDFIEPILIGDPERIKNKIKKLGYESLNEVEVVDPLHHPKRTEYIEDLTKAKQREGISYYHAEDLMGQETYFSNMMLRDGLVNAVMSGPTLNFPQCFSPAMRVIGTKDKRKAAGIFILVFKDRVLFLADCTANIAPNAEDLSEIALSTANLYRTLMRHDPRVAFLSFSNFGSNKHPEAKKVKKAVELTKEKSPKLIVDGELQADVAVNKNILDKLFNFSTLDQPADVLIFPDLNSANISYKLLQQLSDCTAIGPILVPMNKPINIIQRTASITEVVNMVNLTALLSVDKS
ncbi:MAG: NADP-dependent malic enzyme [Bacteriovoracaceae bacterium]